MKIIQLIALTAIGVLAMSSSCKKEESDSAIPCPTISLTVSQIAGWTPTPTCFVQLPADIGQSKTYVLNSEADYKAAFTCSPVPVVDFSKFTLLVGATKTAYGSQVASQQVVQTCSGYEYSVTIQNGLTAVVSTVTYCALVPKLPTSAKVDFKVQVLP